MFRVSRPRWFKRRAHDLAPRRKNRRTAANRRSLTLEPLEERRLLAITVTTLVDQNDGIAVGGVSLRDALAVAGTGEAINFAASLFQSGPGTINLIHGQLNVSTSVAIVGPGRNTLTINAATSDPTPNLDNGDGSRAFVISDGNSEVESNVSISGLTVTGADFVRDGGAILNQEFLTLTDSTISSNAARWGGGLYNDTTGNLLVVNSVISGNRAISPTAADVGSGGGFYNWGGQARVEDSVITENRSPSYGGGVLNANDGQLTIVRSSVSNNIADQNGGGLHNADGDISIFDSTIDGNQAVKGGGLFVVTPFDQLTLIRNSTISGNIAPQGGGGLYNLSGTVNVELSTITRNVSLDYLGSGAAASPTAAFAPTSFYGTIIASNFDPNTPAQTAPYDVAVNGLENSLISLGYNLVGLGSLTDETFSESGDQVLGTSDPQLGPLADNGGPTRTHALLAGSPAVDAGDPNVASTIEVPLFDQRSAPNVRIRDGNGAGGAVIDIGAFEVQPAGAPSLAGDYNGNQIVDAADYTIWRNTLGQVVTPFAGADGNGSGVIDPGDYEVWKLNFGDSMSPASAVGGGSAVPATPIATAATAPNSSDSASESLAVAPRKVSHLPRPVAARKDRNAFPSHDGVLAAWARFRQRPLNITNGLETCDVPADELSAAGGDIVRAIDRVFATLGGS